MEQCSIMWLQRDDKLYKERNGSVIQMTDRLHVFYKAQQADLSLGDLGITRAMNTGEVWERVANYFDRAVEEFSSGYTQQWEENGNLTIRPVAEFGL